MSDETIYSWETLQTVSVQGGKTYTAHEQTTGHTAGILSAGWEDLY